MSDSNDWIREVNGKVDHGIMAFDFYQTNEAKIKSFFGSCRKLKKQGSNFLQTLKSKKQGFYLFANFRKLKKQGFFFKLWELKNKDFIFLQTLKAKKKQKKNKDVIFFANF